MLARDASELLSLLNDKIYRSAKHDYNNQIT